MTPEIKGKKWMGNVDEMYLGGHLINTFDGITKKSANVSFDFFFGIYSVKSIKRGDELLTLYNRDKPRFKNKNK